MTTNNNNDQSEPNKIYKVPTFRRNWSNRRDATNIGISRLSAANNSNRVLREQDPFLYFSQSQRGLDALRFSLGSSHVNIDDHNELALGPVERRSRFSTEVHPMHNTFLMGLMDDEGNEEEVLQGPDDDCDGDKE